MLTLFIYIIQLLSRTSEMEFPVGKTKAIEKEADSERGKEREREERVRERERGDKKLRNSLEDTFSSKCNGIDTHYK